VGFHRGQPGALRDFSTKPALTIADIDVDAARCRRREVPLSAEARLGLIEREVRRLIAEGGDA
jgi:N-carbamoylputrescine amidase